MLVFFMFEFSHYLRSSSFFSHTSWTKNVQYLATTSLDWSVKVWEVATSSLAYSHAFDSMVFRVLCHPTLYASMAVDFSFVFFYSASLRFQLTLRLPLQSVASREPVDGLSAPDQHRDQGGHGPQGGAQR
jgi:hypothetical protein